MNHALKSVLGIAAVTLAAHASAQITFYEREGFRGQTFKAERPVWNFERHGFNDRASSAVVERGRWEVCEDARFEGKCVVLRRGSYDSLRSMGLNNSISSVRPSERRRSASYEEPQPVAAVPAYDWRRRPEERLREVPVTGVRAVMGTPEQRCWVERQAVGEPERRDLNVPGAVIGGIVGGILGHQVGGGTGKTVATIGGAVGGGAIGANVGRGDQVQSTRDIRRCENVSSGTPQYYDVTYDWRGTQHHVQMSSPPPGRTILVNANGEPRL